MRVLIVSVSKGIGLEATRQALNAGHDLRALARSVTAIAFSNPSLKKIRGAGLKTEGLQSAVARVGIVIQILCVGLIELFQPIHLFWDATQIFNAAIKKQGIQRLICTTSSGAGNSRVSVSCLQLITF